MIDRKQDGCARHARRERAPRKHNSLSKKKKNWKEKVCENTLVPRPSCPLFDSLLADTTSLTRAGKQNQKQNANGEAMQSQAP